MKKEATKLATAERAHEHYRLCSSGVADTRVRVSTGTKRALRPDG